MPPAFSLTAELASSTPQHNTFVAESDQEAGFSRPTARPKLKNRPRLSHRKELTSDSEHSYAASIAPRYLAHRRTSGMPESRLPGPNPSSMDSRDSSKRTSPDKRQACRTGELVRPSSPPPSKLLPSSANRGGKVRIASRSTPKEKS